MTVRLVNGRAGGSFGPGASRPTPPCSETRSGQDLASQPKTIVLDPRLGFGQPVIAGTGIEARVVAGRYRAGESVQALSADYGVGTSAIEDAIRGGVRRVHVVSYKSPEGILGEVFTNEGTGTLIVADINAIPPDEQQTGGAALPA